MAKTNDKDGKTKAPRGDAAVADETPENLDKVRDILFGGQMRSVESRFARLEERLQQDQEQLRQQTEQKLGALEAYTKKELEALGDRLKAERTARAEDMKGITALLREQVSALDQRIATLDDDTSKADADMRDLVLENTKQVMTQLQQVSDHLSEQLKQEATELRAEKADTASLIELFSDMAMRLSEDFQPAPERK